MRDARLLFGPLAAALLLVGVGGLALLVPGYDPVRQTVSEIGEVGSPMRWPFTGLLCAVASCVLVFAAGLDGMARREALSRWPGWLVGAFAVSAAGVGAFAFPHPLHNVFGLTELIGYQAPLVLALAWRRGAPEAARLSALMAVAVWLVLALNLTAVFRDPVVWPHLKPVYGLAQRALFASWFAWIAWLGLRLTRRT